MGGGGDNGYEARQQQIEGNKEKARQYLNALFGVGPSSGAQSLMVAPDRAKFTSQAVSGHYMPISENAEAWVPDTTEKFDQTGYDQAMAEYQRQAGLASQAQSNSQNRDSLYQQVRDNAFTAGKRKLDEDYADARRKNKFELFARGLSGGSEDIDQNARQKRVYDQGVIDLGAKADSAKANFRNEDEQTRLQLLESINNGTDQGSALSAATNRMAVAADQAAADAQGTALGNVFDTAGLLYSQSQASKGRQSAQDWWNQYSGGGKKAGTNTTGTLSNGSAYN